MVSINLTIQDSQVDRVLTAMSYDGVTPKAQFVKTRLIDYIKRTVKNNEVVKAQADAVKTAEAKVDSEIIIS